MMQFANYSANWLEARYRYHSNYTNHVSTVAMASVRLHHTKRIACNIPLSQQSPWDTRAEALYVRYSCQPGDVFEGPQLRNPRTMVSHRYPCNHIIPSCHGRDWQYIDKWYVGGCDYPAVFFIY